MKRACHWILALATGTCLLACAGPVAAPAGAGSPQLIRSAAFEHCPWQQPALSGQWLRDEAQWKAFLDQARPGAGELVRWNPRFGDQGVFFYGPVQRPSSGYALQIGPLAWGADGRTLQVSVVHVEPPEGSLRATVMTSPCIVGLVQAPRAERVQVQVVGAAPGGAAPAGPPR